jgi:hypothetical protein
MKPTFWIAVLTFALVTVGCSKKKEETETVPPGFCATSAECQPIADRQQARQNELRDRLAAQGVHDQYLPCGTYQPAKAPNGYWAVTQDKTGCSPTASQQDPHPDPSKAKQSKH